MQISSGLTFNLQGGGFTVNLPAGGSLPTLNSFSIENTVHDGVSFSVNSQDSTPRDIDFNSDGTKMYLIGLGSDSFHQYSLSTPFDLSTASYDSVSFSVSSQDSTPQDMAISDDGTKLFMLGISGTLYQYNLSTPFDLSTASYSGINVGFSGQDTAASGIDFADNGARLYMVGGANDRVYQYSLSTPFDLSTLTYDNISFAISQESSPFGLVVDPTGERLFVVGNATDSVYQYSLTTPFDLSTASYDNVSFNFSPQDTGAAAVAFNNNGTKMYLVGFVSDSIHQYSLS